MKTEILRLSHISKSFSGIKVLNNVNLNLLKGEVLGLIGENGAGKTTLVKILSGIYPKDTGKIYFEEKAIELDSPQDPLKLGISIIHQELNLIPELTIAENVLIFRENIYRRVFFSKKATYYLTKELLDIVDLKVDPFTLVKDLSTAQRQLVEIVKALSINSKLIIMDETTASLAEKETSTLKAIIRKLSSQGVSIIFISHKLDEVLEICNRITILRGGSTVETLIRKECTKEKLIALMIGCELKDIYVKSPPNIGKEILRVESISTNGLIKGISFSLNKGEILGFTGLDGSGRTELMKALFGIVNKTSGTIYIHGIKVEIRKPGDAIKHKMGMIPEDRRLQGLILRMAISENISLPVLEKVSTKGFVISKAKRFLSKEFIKNLSIMAASEEQEVIKLSGGNQQKVVVAKWFAIRPEILIMDEPTRGIDIATKREIYTHIDILAQQGVAIILVSSDVQEIVRMSDRIIIMHEGQIRGELTREEATQEKIITMQISKFSSRFQ